MQTGTGMIQTGEVTTWVVGSTTNIFIRHTGQPSGGSTLNVYYNGYHPARISLLPVRDQPIRCSGDGGVVN